MVFYHTLLTYGNRLKVNKGWTVKQPDSKETKVIKGWTIVSLDSEEMKVDKGWTIGQLDNEKIAGAQISDANIRLIIQT